MEKGTESDSALSGQTEKHIVSLDALCNLAPFTPQSEKSMANGRPKHQTPCVCVRERDRKKQQRKKKGQKERAHCSWDRMINTHWKLRGANIMSKASSL